MAKPQNGVNAEDVKKIAKLSRLHVEADSLQPIAEDLNGICRVVWSRICLFFSTN